MRTLPSILTAFTLASAPLYAQDSIAPSRVDRSFTRPEQCRSDMPASDLFIFRAKPGESYHDVLEYFGNAGVPKRMLDDKREEWVGEGRMDVTFQKPVTFSVLYSYDCRNRINVRYSFIDPFVPLPTQDLETVATTDSHI